MKRFLFCIALMVTGQAGQAADIEAYTDDYMRCIVRLSGPIEAGDAKRLENVLLNVLAGGQTREEAGKQCFDGTIGCLNSEHRRICLSSPGGSFSEALKIAELIHGFMGTAVPRDAECLSSCTLVFMAGSSGSGGPMGVAINRKLHAAGRLGFHAPKLEVARGDYSKAEVERAYQLANEGLAGLMNRSSDMLLSQTLVAEMLATPADDMMYVDTVYKAGRWLIPVAGTVYPREITETAASNACNTFYGWTLDRLEDSWVGVDPSPFWRDGFDAEFETYDDPPEVRLRMDGFGPEAALTCHVTVRLDPSPDDTRGIWGDYGHIWLGEAAFEASPATFFDPMTPLAVLVRPRDEELSFRDVPETTPEGLRLVEAAACYIFDGAELRASAPCRRETARLIEDDVFQFALSTFVWDSGETTMLKISRTYPEWNRIDGQVAEIVHGGTPVEGATCYRNPAAGTTFCFE